MKDYRSIYFIPRLTHLLKIRVESYSAFPNVYQFDLNHVSKKLFHQNTVIFSTTLRFPTSIPSIVWKYIYILIYIYLYIYPRIVWVYIYTLTQTQRERERRKMQRQIRFICWKQVLWQYLVGQKNSSIRVTPEHGKIL